MADVATLYVSINPNGGWDVRHGKGGKSLLHCATRVEAERAARRVIAETGGGQVCVEVADGQASEGATRKS